MWGREGNMFKNKWKAMFLGLAAINLLVIIIVLVMVGLPPKQDMSSPGDDWIREETEFTIISTKKDLNQLMNSYLDDLSKKKNMEYSVSLEDDVMLQGTILAFGKEVSLTMTFEPVVQKNGDLLLKQKAIKLGRLQLPSKKVLDYLRDNYELPEWVQVEPKKEQVYVALTEMKTKSNFKVKVEKFNPEKNQFAFKITVPNKSFGLAARAFNMKALHE